VGKIYLSTSVGTVNASKRGMAGQITKRERKKGSFLSIYLTHKELLVTSIINSNPRSNYGAGLQNSDPRQTKSGLV